MQDHTKIWYFQRLLESTTILMIHLALFLDYMSKIWNKRSEMSVILDTITNIFKKSKIQKSVFNISRTHIEVPLGQISASQHHFSRKNCTCVVFRKIHFCEKDLNYALFSLIFIIFSFLSSRSLQFIKMHQRLKKVSEHER